MTFGSSVRGQKGLKHVEQAGIDGKPSNSVISRLSGKPDQNQKIQFVISGMAVQISKLLQVSFLKVIDNKRIQD